MYVFEYVCVYGYMCVYAQLGMCTCVSVHVCECATVRIQTGQTTICRCREKTNLQLIISRKPKLRAIRQLVSAPLIPRQQLENNLGGSACDNVHCLYINACLAVSLYIPLDGASIMRDILGLCVSLY